MMPDAEKLEHLRGLLDQVDLCLERGRIHPAREALHDAERLDATMLTDEEDVSW